MTTRTGLRAGRCVVALASLAVGATLSARATSVSASALGPEVQLDRESVRLPADFGATVAVACGTRNCVVARTNLDSPRGAGVVFARVDVQTGALLDAREHWIAPGSLMDVACAGDDCVLAFAQSEYVNVMSIRHLRTVHIDANTGSVAGRSAREITSGWGLGLGRLACGPSRCLLGWLVGSNTSAIAVRATRVEPATARALDPGGIEISPPGSNVGGARIGCDGSQCLVAWRSNGAGAMRFRRVGLDAGDVLDSRDVPLGVDATEYDPVSCSSGVCAFAFASALGVGSAFAIAASRVRLADGAVLDPAPREIARWSLPVALRDIACRADTCVLATHAYSGRPATVVRIRPSTGARLDPGGVVVGSDGGLGGWVGCSGARCIVAWLDARGGTDTETFAARVDASSGSVADPGGIAVGTNSTLPSLACASDACLATWQQRDEFSGVGGYAVYGLVVDPATAGVRSSMPSLLVGVGQRQRPSLGCSRHADMCLLGFDAWSRSVAGVLVDPTSAMLVGLPGPRNELSGQGAARSSVGCSDSICLAAWQEESSAGGFDVFARRVDVARGGAIDPAPVAITTAPGDQLQPAVACGATTCAIVWEDAASSPSRIRALHQVWWKRGVV